MRDPHVERLHYNFHGEAGISYGDPPPLSFSNYIGKFSLQNQKLVVEPTDHYSSQDMARATVDSFLCWEIEKDLAEHFGTIRFEFLSADVVDRDPPPVGTSQVVQPNTKCYL